MASPLTSSGGTLPKSGTGALTLAGANSYMGVTTISAGTYDLVSGDGSAVFGGVLNLVFSGGTYADGANVLQLFANAGGRSGNFVAVNFTGLAAGQLATFDPATGFISLVPEPSTWASLLAGLACGSYLRFRRRAR